jgi:RNA polymerase sigma-70 factor (ECF subfamily)
VYEADQKLVKRMLAGEQRAFDSFFCTYAERLVAFAARRSTLPPAAIEDIVQNSLIKALRKLAHFRGESALFTWLCEICRHELASLYRKAARQPEHESVDVLSQAREAVLELRAPEEQDPEHELEAASQRVAVAATLNGLPERYARALEWKYGDGFSVDEIAQMMGLTSVAVQSLLARARLAFRESWTGEVAS